MSVGQFSFALSAAIQEARRLPSVEADIIAACDMASTRLKRAGTSKRFVFFVLNNSAYHWIAVLVDTQSYLFYILDSMSSGRKPPVDISLVRVFCHRRNVANRDLPSGH